MALGWDSGGLVAAISPGGQIDEHTRSRIKALQDRSLISAAVAQFHRLEDRLCC